VVAGAFHRRGPENVPGQAAAEAAAADGHLNRPARQLLAAAAAAAQPAMAAAAVIVLQPGWQRAYAVLLPLAVVAGGVLCTPTPGRGGRGLSQRRC
jgi:hypothetical protein